MKKNYKTNIDLLDKHLPKGMDRRSFLKRMGGGVIIAVAISDFVVLQSCASEESGGAESIGPVEEDFNAFLRIGEDGRVSCYVGKIEMGQGVITSLPQMMAEELEVSVDDIDIVMGDTDLCPYDAGTWGSVTTRIMGPPFMAASAEARETLIALAAKELKVKPNNLKAENGTVFETSNKDNKISYADLAKGKQIVRSLTEKVNLKPKSEYKIIGKSLSRRDAKEKVTGVAKYSADIRLPGMLYAKILRPPTHGATRKSLDLSGLDKYEGLEIVNEGDLVAVLHADPEIAQEAIDKVKADWDIPESKADDKTVFEFQKKVGTKENTVEEQGDLKVGEESSDIVIEEEYYDGYKAHATIETHTATAVMEGDKLTMWASSQTPFGTREAISKELGMPLEKVHMKENFLGGGFGGKIYNPQAIEAAKLAKITGKPLQLSYTRREEFMYDYFRPATTITIKSGCTNDGKISLWDYDVYFAGARGSQIFYDFPNKRVATRTNADGEPSAHPFPTGAWRAPHNNSNTFARESHIDVMAHKLGIDPVEFRLKNTKNERVLDTIKAAADAFGWTPIKSPSGKGVGIAVGFDAGAYVATIAEVKVNEKTGEVQPIRVVCAQDCGLVVNPLGTKLQVEGGIIMGLGYALTEDIEFDWGKVKTRNFDSYEITRFSKTPVVEAVLVDSRHEPPEGGGEPSIITAGGAIANAIFDACGARVHQMPMTPERVLAAMQKG